MSGADGSPSWVKDAIFYQIFPDRFAKSEKVPKPSNLEPWHSRPTYLGFKGGDLLGICERLDYLVDLGVNAIYLNPIFQSTWNHRYGTTDFFHVDPILGGDAAFKRLLDATRERGMRVIIDGVFNHVGRGFYQFQHALDNLQGSPYLDWFYIKWWPLNAYDGEKLLNYEAFYDRRGLPKLNVSNDSVKEFLLDVVEYWTRFGIDGWRLDAPDQINDLDFWRDFRRRVKNISSDVYLVGELWGDAHEWLRGDIFDATTNYPFLRTCLGFFGQGRLANEFAKNAGWECALSAADFDTEIQRLLSMHSTNVCQMQLNHLDSHDTARFISMCGEDITSLKLATLFQMTFPGAPSIYYGDEIGMNGGPDPDCRRAFPWNSEDIWNYELLSYFKKCIELRKQHPVLRDGQFITLHAQDKAYAYIRSSEKQKILVVLNVDESAHELAIEFPANIFDDSHWIMKPLMDTSQHTVDVVANKLNIVLPARDAAVFVMDHL